MIDQFRTSLKGWFSSAIIIVIAIAMGTWGIHYYKNKDSDRVIAKINGVPITHQIVKNLATISQKKYPQTNIENWIQITENHFKQQEKLINYFNNSGYQVSDSILKAQLNSSYQQLNQNNGGLNAFIERLARANGMNVRLFMESVRFQIQESMVHNTLSQNSTPTPQLIDKEYRLLNQKRRIKVFQLDDLNALDSDHEFTESKVKQYYTQNKSNLKTSHQVSIDYIVLDKNLIPKKDPSEEMIRKRYEENPPLIKDQVEFTIATLKIDDNSEISQDDVENIRNTFLSDDNAKTLNSWLNKKHIHFSQSTQNEPVTKKNQDLAVNSIVTTETKTALTLKKVSSFHMKKDSYEHANASIKNQLIAEYVDQIFEQNLAKFNSVGFSSDNLNDVAQAFTPELTILHSSLFSMNDPQADIIQLNNTTSKTTDKINRKIHDLAFTSELTADHRNSDVIPYSNAENNQQGAIIFRIRENEPAHQLTLEDAKPIILKKLEEQRKENWLKDSTAKIKNNPDIVLDHVHVSSEDIQYNSDVSFINPEYTSLFINELWTYGEGSFYSLPPNASHFLKKPDDHLLIYIKEINLNTDEVPELKERIMQNELYYSLYTNSILHEHESTN